MLHQLGISLCVFMRNRYPQLLSLSSNNMRVLFGFYFISVIHAVWVFVCGTFTIVQICLHFSTYLGLMPRILALDL